VTVVITVSDNGRPTRLDSLVGGWPTFSVRDYASRLSVGAPLLSPAFGDGVGTIFTRGASPMCSRRRPVQSDSISTTPSLPLR